MEAAPLPESIGEIAAESLEVLRDVVREMDDADLVRSTGCRGWHVAHLLVHLRYDAHELVEGLVMECDSEPDRDYVTYWADWPAPTEVSFSDVRFHWAGAAAYATGSGLREHFDHVVRAAVAAARRPAPARVRFQGHVMSSADFLAMWVVECVVHHLDLLVAVPGAPGPPPAAVAIAVATVDAMLGRGRLDEWSECRYLRKVTGREQLEASELTALGEHAGRIPVFG